MINNHLETVLESHKMSKVEKLLEKFIDKRNEVKEALEKQFGSSIYAPFNSGSYAKITAINTKFDIDLVVPFKRDYRTLEEMFEDVLGFLEEKYSEVAEVRPQKVSIGLYFPEDEDGDKIEVDVVPGREFNKEQFNEDKNLNLYFNSTLGNFEEKSFIKTNIHAQIEHIKGKENERKVIRLLKIWKTSNSRPYKSFFLELATIKAFESKEITGSLWDKLKSVIEYIKDNVTKSSFKLLDPGNGGNDVAETLDNNQKLELQSELSIILDRVANNEANIKSYFPVNDNFNDTYEVDKSKSSTNPQKIQRFG